MWRYGRPEGLVQRAGSKSTSSAHWPALERPQHTGFLWFGSEVLLKEHRELGKGWLNVMLPTPPSVLSPLCALGLVFFTSLPDSSWQKGPALDLLALALPGDFIRCGWHGWWRDRWGLSALGDRLDFCSPVAGCQPWRARNGCSTCQ